MVLLAFHRLAHDFFVLVNIVDTRGSQDAAVPPYNQVLSKGMKGSVITPSTNDERQRRDRLHRGEGPVGPQGERQPKLVL